MHPVMPLAASGSVPTPVSAVQAMLADIALAAQAPLAERPRAVAGALARHLADPALLAGRDCPCAPESYTRYLLHADPAGAYAVVALVWRPGQMSPVHAHRAWCAFGVHRGALTEGFYDPGADDGLPRPSGAVLRRSGEVCHGPADPHLIHRLANLSCREAVSIHVYGVAYDRFGSALNEVYAD